MTYAELEAKAKRYLATFPDQTPEQIYINGFLQGYRQHSLDNAVNEEVTASVLRGVDYASVQEMFNNVCKGFSRVASLSEKRREKVRARWNEMLKLGAPLGICRTVFDKMQASAFLKGGNARGWKATFDWLFENSNNWLKVYEGQYDDKPGKPDDKKVNSFWDE